MADYAFIVGIENYIENSLPKVPYPNKPSRPAQVAQRGPRQGRGACWTGAVFARIMNRRGARLSSGLLIYGVRNGGKKKRENITANRDLSPYFACGERRGERCGKRHYPLYLQSQ